MNPSDPHSALQVAVLLFHVRKRRLRIIEEVLTVLAPGGNEIPSFNS